MQNAQFIHVKCISVKRMRGGTLVNVFHSCFENVSFLEVTVGAGSLEKVISKKILIIENPFFDSVSKMYLYANTAPSHSLIQCMFGFKTW